MHLHVPVSFMMAVDAFYVEYPFEVTSQLRLGLGPKRLKNTTCIH